MAIYSCLAGGMGSLCDEEHLTQQPSGTAYFRSHYPVSCKHVHPSLYLLLNALTGGRAAVIEPAHPI